MIRLLLIPSFIALILFACKNNQQTVVIYTSVDQVYSEPIFNQFEKETGIEVLQVFDVESVKTTGLVNRIIAEKDYPVADLFWNGEFAQTIILQQLGILQPYVSPNSHDIPKNYKDSLGFWTGFSGRARIILVNTQLLIEEDYPQSIYDLLNQKYPSDKIGIAYPVFGTTYTHASALYSYLGIDEANSLFTSINKRGVRILPGNATVRDLVVNGELLFGLTDTDDACQAVNKGEPVKVIYPEQTGIGALVIPNTIAMIKGAPNPKAAKIFIDYILSKGVAIQLLQSGWAQIPLRSFNVTPKCDSKSDLKKMEITLNEIFQQMGTTKEMMQKIFIQ